MPGAGSVPAVLAGREEQIQAARLAVTRTAAGYSETGAWCFFGLRGVGKTVLLNYIKKAGRPGRSAQDFHRSSGRGRVSRDCRCQAARIAAGACRSGKKCAERNRHCSALPGAARVTVGDMAIEHSPGIADKRQTWSRDMQTVFEAVGEAAAEQKDCSCVCY